MEARGGTTTFRPCVDLHGGVVKQIVGGTLTDEGAVENHASALPPAHFVRLYRAHGLEGGHVIKLGPGNDGAAREALAAWPGGLQLGGGINADNAPGWIGAGASKVVVTSWLFPERAFSEVRAHGHTRHPRPPWLRPDPFGRRGRRSCAGRWGGRGW